MGRPAKPTALKRLQGNPGKRALNDDEPRFTKGAPPCPSDLSAAAKSEWRHVVRELEKTGMLTRIDRSALTRYCNASADYFEARQQLAEHGQTIERPKYGTTVSPWKKIERQALETMERIGGQFGFTPSTRAKLHAPPPVVEDPLDALMREYADAGPVVGRIGPAGTDDTPGGPTGGPTTTPDGDDTPTAG